MNLERVKYYDGQVPAINHNPFQQHSNTALAHTHANIKEKRRHKYPTHTNKERKVCTDRTKPTQRHRERGCEQHKTSCTSRKKDCTNNTNSPTPKNNRYQEVETFGDKLAQVSLCELYRLVFTANLKTEHPAITTCITTKERTPS